RDIPLGKAVLRTASSGLTAGSSDFGLNFSTDKGIFGRYYTEKLFVRVIKIHESDSAGPNQDKGRLNNFLTFRRPGI
ncbi:hypothetical protein L7A47_31825, partial [Achromobacter xylosoxidans]|uniref:hypothetical protein n=1 Tax=Alcaligenes xylosoxydans xylosoxydans TaxID=85698 RepID=UPI001F10B49F